jgi:hypothetical protein
MISPVRRVELLVDRGSHEDRFDRRTGVQRVTHLTARPDRVSVREAVSDESFSRSHPTNASRLLWGLTTAARSRTGG